MWFIWRPTPGAPGRRAGKLLAAVTTLPPERTWSVLPVGICLIAEAAAGSGPASGLAPDPVMCARYGIDLNIFRR